MRNINTFILSATLALGLLSPAYAVDNIVTDKSGHSYLVDNANNLWPLDVAYTTNGNSDILTVNGLAVVSDDLVIPANTGKAYLRDNSDRLFPASVSMTTDGAGNVIPISGGNSSLAFTAPLVDTAGTVAINGDVADNKLAFKNSSDATKRMAFSLGGAATSTALTVAPQNTSNMILHVPQVATAGGAGMALVQDETTGFIFSSGITSSIGAANSMMQLANASTANRAQIKLHSYFNGASVAGVSTLTSRSGTIGTNAAVVAGQDYSKWTAQAGATTAGSAPISGAWAFKANTVNSLTVTSDFHLQLTNLAGTLGDRLIIGSEGAMQLPGYGAGIGHFDASGNLTSSAVNLAGSDVTGLLPIANQVSQPHTQVIEVDMNRVDSYTADGSLTRPYKTIKAAVDASTCTSSALCLFQVAPGAYVEDNALAFKEWMYVDGVQRDLVTIRRTDSSPIVVDLTANVSHRVGFSNLTFIGGLIVDRTGDTTGGVSLDMMNVWVSGTLSDVGVGSGRDYLNMKHCFITGAATISGVSGIMNWSSFMSTLDLGTTGAVSADGYGYYALMTFEGSYIAGNLGATAAAAKPMGLQTFHTNGDGAWSIVGTAAIDYYTDASGPLAGSAFTKTNVTTYRYGHLENLTYEPNPTNWAGTAPTNVHDALERMAALMKTLNGGTAIP